MLLVLIKKSLKNKVFMWLFVIFTLLSGAFIGFPMMVSVASGFTVEMKNNVMWTMTFCVFMVVLLIILVVLKTVIFDRDLEFLIKIELQYHIKKLTIYFSRFFVLLIYAFVYITFILICYFIYTITLIPNHMKINVFMTATVGYVAYLYLFSLGTIAVLFLTTFIKNNGLKFSLPFMILLPFIGMTINAQFFMAPSYNQVSYEEFIMKEKEFLNYQKFQQSGILTKYLDCFDNPQVTNQINIIFPANQKNNFSDYNAFFKDSFYSASGAPNEINYSPNHRSITAIFHDLAAKTKNDDYKPFFTQLAQTFNNFEINNMFNLNLLQDGDDSLGFLTQKEFKKAAYNEATSQYNFSIDSFIAQHFIKLTKKYCQPISSDIVQKFQDCFDGFKKQTTIMGYLFFWEQSGYLLSGSSYNINTDLDRAAISMPTSPMQRMVNFDFANKDSGYIISNSKIVRAYSYEFIVILYLTIITIMNYGAYMIFSKKIME